MMRNTSFDIMKLILQFVYVGEVKVITELLAEFMETAEYLQIRGLTNNKTPEIKTEVPNNDCENDNVDNWFDVPNYVSDNNNFGIFLNKPLFNSSLITNIYFFLNN